MKKILLTIFLVICFVGVGNAQTTLALQEKCAEGAKKFFDDGGLKFKERMESGTWYNNYEWHYNKKLDKCFILVTSFRESGGKEGLTYHYEVLYDVFEGKIYGEISGFVGEATSGIVKGKSCKSQVECEALIKPYMEE